MQAFRAPEFTDRFLESGEGKGGKGKGVLRGETCTETPSVSTNYEYKL